MIISSNPQVTNHYLGRVDGWLREQGRRETGFIALESSTDEYFGAALIDTPHELRELKDTGGRVWVIADVKASLFSSQDTHDLLQSEYAKYQEIPGLAVYVNAQ